MHLRLREVIAVPAEEATSDVDDRLGITSAKTEHD